jgi:hypothetical protein
VRSAPAHLESKLRFWDFSVGQIAAAFAGIMLGVVWAKFLSPLHGMWSAMSGAYIAALPVIPLFVASQTEFDLCGLVIGALRWRRLDGCYVPGAGEQLHGYVLSVEHAEADQPGGGAELDLQALWEDASPSPDPSATRRLGALRVSARERWLTDGAADGRDSRAFMNNGKEKR